MIYDRACNPETDHLQLNRTGDYPVNYKCKSIFIFFTFFLQKYPYIIINWILQLS
jgi:hypothetical protein